MLNRVNQSMESAVNWKLRHRASQWVGATCLFLMAMLSAPSDVLAQDVEIITKPGIVQTITANGKTDSRVVRQIALYVPMNERPTPFLDEDLKLKARMTGFINIGLRGRYYFTVAGRGTFKLSIDGNVVLEGAAEDLSTIEKSSRIRMGKGANPFVLEYEAPGKGHAEVVIYWESSDFPRERIRPQQLTHDPATAELIKASLIREGRELFASMRCAKCHTMVEFDMTKAMPELSMDAPSLKEAGSRASVRWMAHWINNPKALRPDASMPMLKFYSHQQGEVGKGPRGQAWHIAAYLDTLGKKPDAIKPATPDMIKTGGDLFAKFGCIGCHTMPDHVDAKTARDRVSLKHVKAKWHPASLAAFLKKPNAHYQWIRMPLFGFSDEEAKLLAAFVLSRKGAELDGPPAGFKPNAEAGKELVRVAGCMNCHEIEGENSFSAPTLATISKKNWDAGCLTAAESNRGQGADYGLNESQTNALRAFAGAGFDSLHRRASDEFAQRQVNALRCQACHRRDGVQDHWSLHEKEVEALLLVKPKAKSKDGDNYDDDFGDDFGDGQGGEAKEATIDQSRPVLTFVGEKLKPQWMQKLFAGELKYKPRTWLHAKMPAFPARAKELSRGLALQHGCAPVADEEPKPAGELAVIGKRFVGKNNGFSCVLCHGVGKQAATNVFEAQGVNFQYVRERLRHEYFMRWLLKPARIRSDTRMPQFASEDGYTPYTDVFDGDARKQFDAIWQYLLQGREIKPPN